MKQFSVLFQKEWREHARNFKLIWIPIVFILLGITEPIINHFLPQIIQSAGNVPEGTVISFPELMPEQILLSALNQYQFIGMLIVAFAFAGLVARERKNGTAAFLYVRPLSFPAYILSKWTLGVSILLGSLLLGMLGAAYYTDYLFGDFSIPRFIGMLGIYSIWMVFALSVTLLLSSLLRPGIAAAIAVFVIAFFPMIDGLVLRYWPYTPFKLFSYAGMVMMGDVDTSDLWITVAIAVLLIVVCVTVSILMAKKKAADVKI